MSESCAVRTFVCWLSLLVRVFNAGDRVPTAPHAPRGSSDATLHAEPIVKRVGLRASPSLMQRGPQRRRLGNVAPCAEPFPVTGAIFKDSKFVSLDRAENIIRGALYLCLLPRCALKRRSLPMCLQTDCCEITPRASLLVVLRMFWDEPHGKNLAAEARGGCCL